MTIEFIYHSGFIYLRIYFANRIKQHKITSNGGGSEAMAGLMGMLPVVAYSTPTK